MCLILLYLSAAEFEVELFRHNHPSTSYNSNSEQTECCLPFSPILAVFSHSTLLPQILHRVYLCWLLTFKRAEALESLVPIILVIPV